MEKPEVVIFLFRWKRKVKPSKNIPSNTISGIISSTATLSNLKMPAITQVSNSTSINKYSRPKLTGSLTKDPKMSQDKFNNLSMIFRENLTPWLMMLDLSLIPTLELLPPTKLQSRSYWRNTRKKLLMGLWTNLHPSKCDPLTPIFLLSSNIYALYSSLLL